MAGQYDDAVLQAWVDAVRNNGVKNSMNRFVGDGVTTVYDINFAGGYLNKADILAYKVSPGNAKADVVVTAVNDNKVTIAAPVESGWTLVIYRDTPKSFPLVDFADNSIINEKNLDTNFKQTVFGVAELLDRFDDTVQFTLDAYTAASNAQASATAASASKDAAAASASSALASANSAAASAAAASADRSAVSVTAQQVSSNATAATAAANTAVQAANTATGAATATVQASEELFNRYYGPLASDPTTRPDGSPVQEGDEYFNTVAHKRKTWDGTAWVMVTADAGIGPDLSTTAGWDAVPSSQGAGGVSSVMNAQARALLANIFADRKATAVNVLRFLGADYDGTTNAYPKLVDAWEYCVTHGLDLYMPALPNGAKYVITSENNFPFGRLSGLPPTELLECKNVTIFGDGPATVLRTQTVHGADVIQTNGGKNIHYRNLRIEAAISGTSAGSNGISITGGFDNVTAEWIWVDSLPFVDKGNYVDGGKALSIQTPVANQTVKCGTFRARNIFATGCVYGVGVEQDLLAASTMPTSIDVEITAENCRDAVVVSGGEATGPIPSGWNSGITIRATAVNCMRDVSISRGYGVNVTCNVVTTKSPAARILSPTGGKWAATDTTADVVGLVCAYAKNSFIHITGNKGACQYKARVGGAGAGASGAAGTTDRSTIIVDLAGTSVVEDFGSVDSGGNVTTNCRLYALGATAAPNIEHYLPSRGNAITVGNTALLNDLLVQGAMRFTYTDGKTSYASVGYDDESITIQQTANSSATARTMRVLNHAGSTVFGVRNDGSLLAPTIPSTVVSTLSRSIPVYDSATGMLWGYIPVYASSQAQ